MDSQQLQKLFASLGPPLVLYARQWCTTPEDAVQEAFIDLSHCESEPLSPKAWLYTTTRRKAQNISRSEWRQRNHLELWSQASDTTRDADCWMESHTGNGIAASDVLDGLEQLDPTQREMIIAKIWGDLSFEELGELMHCSSSTAYRRYSAALTELKHSILSTNASNNNPSATWKRS